MPREDMGPVDDVRQHPPRAATGFGGPRRRRWGGLIAALAMIAASMGAAPAFAAPAPAPSPVCTAPDVHDTLRHAAAFAPADPSKWPAVQVISRYPRVPLDASIDIALHEMDSVAFDWSKVAGYRVAVQFGRLPVPSAEKSALVDGLSVFARQIGEGDAMVRSRLVGKAEPLLTLVAPVPRAADTWGHWGWHSGVITVIGCDAARQPVFIARAPATYSDRSTCILLALVAVLLLYLLISLAAWSVDQDKRAAGFGRHWRAHLDPVTLTSDPENCGSISRLQLLFFTLLVGAILAYVLVRVGVLSDLSPTVLYLMGISAVGAAAAKATDVNKNRLEFVNWSWLIGKHWLPKFGIAATRNARWRDLVTADDGFDIYHFQMLLFSLVVGVALLQQGFEGLANFDIPEALLGVLGLSQVVYVGGKTVAPANCKDLNVAVTELRELETKFYVKASSAPLAGATLAARFADARTRAGEEYRAYRKKVEEVRVMFQNVIGPLPTGVGGESEPDFEPRCE